MFPYKVQLQQPLTQSNFDQRFNFANDVLELIRNKTTDVKRIHFSDEAYFQINGYVNKQNYRYWGTENPHLSVIRPLHPQKVSVWCAISHGGIIGPFFLSKYVDQHVYRDEVLNKFIPKAQSKRQVSNFWFQQDGATSHRTEDNCTNIQCIWSQDFRSRCS